MARSNRPPKTWQSAPPSRRVVSWQLRKRARQHVRGPDGANAIMRPAPGREDQCDPDVDNAIARRRLAPESAIVPAAATGRPSLAFLAAARLRAHDSFALTAVTAGARPRGPVCAEAVARDGRLSVAVVAAWLGERRRNRRRARSQPWSRSRRRGSSPGAATRYQRRGACRARPLRLGGCASGESGQPSHE